MKYLFKLLIWFLLLLGSIAASFYVYSMPVIVAFVLLSFVLLVPKDTLKNPRILIWIFFIILSIVLIGPNIGARGFYVNSGELAGSTIYSIDDKPVSADLLSQNFYGTVKIDTNKGVSFLRANGSLGLDAEPVQPTNLKFGLDLKGGVRAVLEPETSDNLTIEQIISTLQTRINVYGLRESVFRPVYYEGKGYVEISIAGGSRDELRSLLENQGRFEAKITINPRAVGGKGVVKLDKNYNFSLTNSTVTINNVVAKSGDELNLSDIKFVVDSVASDRFNMTASVFNGNDIRTVFFDPQRSRIEPTSTGYSWSFAVQISPEGAQRFALITNNLDSVVGGYLSSPIVLYLDEKLVDSLSISSTLKGRAETEITISGPANDLKSATAARSQLQSILRSGALPTAVKIVQLDTVSPTLGSGFLTNAALAGLAAIIGVLIVVSVRYRRLKIVLPMSVISFSEVLIILGIAALIGWTIDLPAIAGIIASVGTGVDSQIMIIDQALRGEDKTLTMREKLKRAFFVVFGAAGVVIAAMIPLMAIGFGLLRGFAITTIIGVLVGVLIARPAYGEIVKKLVKD